MKNYYDEYVGLAIQLCAKEDYADIQKVKKNNQAIDKLFLLEKEMVQRGYDDIFLALMGHNNEKVRLSAAAACLQSNTHSDKAIETLKNIIQYSNDSTYRFEAEMILRTKNV